MTLTDNRRFWDRKAKENAYWYVSSYGSYSARNLDEFWDSGARIWRDLKGILNYVPRSTDVVVEVGCGVGRLTRAIAPEVGHVHSLDISKEMIRLAEQHVTSRNVTFHHSDGESLRPISDASADIVLAYCVFQHLPSEEVLAGHLQEMVRVAKSGALLAFTLTPRTWRFYLLALLRVRRRILERLSAGGPRELYKHEWVGIRPRAERVLRLAPVSLALTRMPDDKWLFHART